MKREIIKKADGNEARYYLILSVKDGQKISWGVLARLLKKLQKKRFTRSTIAELFEQEDQRQPIIAENDGIINL